MKSIQPRARAFMTAALITAASALSSTPASAVIQCGVTSSPSMPSTSTGAFGQDVVIEAAARAACDDDGSPGAVDVCVAARREFVSGSTAFASGSNTIPYALTINGIAVDDTDTEVFVGTVPSTGTDLPVSFFVRSEDYAGKAEGAYDATVTWTISHDPAICN